MNTDFITDAGRLSKGARAGYFRLRLDGVQKDSIYIPDPEVSLQVVRCGGGYFQDGDRTVSPALSRIYGRGAKTGLFYSLAEAGASLCAEYLGFVDITDVAVRQLQCNLSALDFRRSRVTYDSLEYERINEEMLSISIKIRDLKKVWFDGKYVSQKVIDDHNG